MNRCPKIEYGRLHGELCWGGFNSRIITSKRPSDARLMNDDSKKTPPQMPDWRSGTRLRDARGPCRRAARPDHRRARPCRSTRPPAYVFDDVDHAASLFNLPTFGYIYSRLTNPTVAVLEERIASLEGGRGATACASGHAAQLLAFFTLMEPGDEFVASRKLYGGSLTQFGQTFTKFGWEVIFVDPDEPANFRRRR